MKKGYIERVEIEKVDKTGNQDGLDVLLGFVVLFEVESDLRDFVEEESGDVLSVFSLDWSNRYDLGDELFQYGNALIAKLLKHDDKILDKVLSVSNNKKMYLS